MGSVTVLHGDNVVNSRQQLHTVLADARAQSKKVIRLTASKLTLPELELAFGSDDLFGNDRFIVLEELHSLPPSQRKTSFIKFLSGVANQPLSPDFVLWEKRSLTATMLKQFGSARATEFKTAPILFTWLDSLSGAAADKPKQLRLFHQVLETEAAELCLAMLIRQIRLLLQVVAGNPVKGAPFMVAKLTKQAQRFSPAQLLHAHRQLLTVEIGLKTGTNPGTLVQMLDLFLLKM